jgi:ABC-2 type transport system ATP-binding protein
MPDVAIRTDALTREFPHIRAIDALTLEVPLGIVFGFLGPNGSGKTTTIRVLLGLVKPTSGTATVLGFDAASQAEQIRARSGALLEHAGIYERLSAEENLELYGRIAQVSVGERRSRIHELLRGFGLWDRRKERAGTWSRGMKQKLAVARALLHRPALIFLDEPTAGMDPVASVTLCEALAALARREGITVFLTTHNLAEAEKLCARVAVIRQGRVLAQGSPSDLRTSFGGRRAEIFGRGFRDPLLAVLRSQPEVISAAVDDGRLLLELRTDAKVSPLVHLMVGAGAEIEEIRRGQVNLEDVFLTLVEEDTRAQ